MEMEDGVLYDGGWPGIVLTSRRLGRRRLRRILCCVKAEPLANARNAPQHESLGEQHDDERGAEKGEVNCQRDDKRYQNQGVHCG